MRALGTDGARRRRRVCLAELAETTLDIYLNDNAFWRNVPAAVWTYKLGGYQVLKKWLSYRERRVLGRVLTPQEVQRFTGDRPTDRGNTDDAIEQVYPCGLGTTLRASNMTKPSVYVETSVVSYLTARRSRELVLAAQQKITRDWWRDAPQRFVLVASELVFTEAAAGDPDAARARLEALTAVTTA